MRRSWATLAASAHCVLVFATAEVGHSVLVGSNHSAAMLVVELLRLDWRAEAADGRLSCLHLGGKRLAVVYLGGTGCRARILRTKAIGSSNRGHGLLAKTVALDARFLTG